MKYTIDDLEKDISDIITELAEMRKAKGHDYSGTEDTLDNLREFGTLGVVVRIGDKFKRLKHFFKQKNLQVSDENITDTMKDLINYSLFLLIMWRQEGNVPKHTDAEELELLWRKYKCIETTGDKAMWRQENET